MIGRAAAFLQSASLPTFYMVNSGAIVDVVTVPESAAALRERIVPFSKL